METRQSKSLHSVDKRAAYCRATFSFLLLLLETRLMRAVRLNQNDKVAAQKTKTMSLKTLQHPHGADGNCSAE